MKLRIPPIGTKLFRTQVDYCGEISTNCNDISCSECLFDEQVSDNSKEFNRWNKKRYRLKILKRIHEK